MKIIWQAYDRAAYTGGPIVNAVRLLPALQKKGYNILAVIGHNGTGHPNADQLQKMGIQCYIYQVPQYSEAHVKIFLEAIINFKPDIFVSNVSVQAGFAGKWAQEWGIPVVHTHRSDDELNNGMAQFFFAGPEKWRLSALVCVSQYLLDKIQTLTKDHFYSKVIPSGVFIKEYFTEQTEVSDIKVVYAGRLVQNQKRVKEVLKAFITLAKSRKDFAFTFIGSGEEEFVNELKREIANNNLHNKIRFTGRLEGEKYHQELANHHIIVLLSDYEGIPGALMDGMSCGLVPVAYKIPGIEELIENNRNGILVEDRETSLLQALITLAENPERRAKFSYNARKTIEQNFSIDRSAFLWDELFQTIKSQIIEKKIMEIPQKIMLPRENYLLKEHVKKPNKIRELVRKIKASLFKF